MRKAPLRPAPADGRTVFTAWLPVSELPPGRWTLTLRTGTAHGADGPSGRIPVPPTRTLTGTRWFRASRLGRRYYAKPLPHAGQGALVLRVAPVRPAAALRRRVRGLLNRPSPGGAPKGRRAD